MKFIVVIPARYASSRFPGKPLALVGGRPMVVRVAEQARKSGAAEVIVATDDERIAGAVNAHGFDVVKRSRQIFVRPDVLANGHPDFLPSHHKWLDMRRRLEITILIKNVVRRQKRLVHFADRFAALE